MNRADIIRLAKKAGLQGMATDVVCQFAELEHFATLIAGETLAAKHQGQAQEPEAEVHFANRVMDVAGNLVHVSQPAPPMSKPPPVLPNLSGGCECLQWVMNYRDKPVQPGEHHHRNCKKWYRVIGEAVVTKTEFMVFGEPEENDESHNCDAMGCGSFNHVLVRSELAAAPTAPKDASWA